MKIKMLLAIVFASVLYFACQKESGTNINKTDSQQDFESAAINYLKSQISTNDLNSLDLNNPHIFKKENVAVAVSFSVKQQSERTVMVYEDNNQLNGNWLTISKAGTNANGILITTSFDDTKKSEIIYINGKLVKITQTLNGKTQTTKLSYGSNDEAIAGSKKIDATAVLSSSEGGGGGFNGAGYGELPDVVVTGYINYQPVDFYSLYWETNQNVGYLYSFTYNTGGSGGGGSGGSGGSGTDNGPTNVSPDHPIVDINQELKCFTTNSTSKYYVTVNVNQPIPNSRAVWKGTMNEPVGHTYLSLEEDNSDNSKVIRNLGFYPKNSAKPTSPVDAAIYGDDSNTPAAVNLKITVNSTDFNKILQDYRIDAGTKYNLNVFNCTDFALVALQSININLNSARSSGFLFTGHDPGDLGQDIRALNITTFSQQNGNRAMLRNTSSYNTLLPPARTATCQ